MKKFAAELLDFDKKLRILSAATNDGNKKEIETLAEKFLRDLLSILEMLYNDNLEVALKPFEKTFSHPKAITTVLEFPQYAHVCKTIDATCLDYLSAGHIIEIEKKKVEWHVWPTIWTLLKSNTNQATVETSRPATIIATLDIMLSISVLYLEIYTSAKKDLFNISDDNIPYLLLGMNQHIASLRDLIRVQLDILTKKAK